MRLASAVAVACGLGAMVACSRPPVTGVRSTPPSGYASFPTPTAQTLPVVVADTSCTPDQEYIPVPAYSGDPPQLPAVPSQPVGKIMEGNAYTVYGAVHHLMSIAHSTAFKASRITVVGYVTRTNFGDVPGCALHEPGKPDPVDCRAPVPTFWLADTQDPSAKAVKVMGFASDFAHLRAASRGKHRIRDNALGIDLPVPVPSIGARVKVTGRIAFAYQPPSGQIEVEPRTGIFRYEAIEYLEPAPKPAVVGPAR